MHWVKVSVKLKPIPPPGNPLSIWTFEDWLVQIPSPRGKKAVQMSHQLVLKYLSSKTNFVFNQTPYYSCAFQREICRNDTFKLLLKSLLKELFTNKGKIPSSKSVKPCKNRKKLTGVYDAKTRDKSGSNSPPSRQRSNSPSPGTIHMTNARGFSRGMLKLQFYRHIKVSWLWDNCIGSVLYYYVEWNIIIETVVFSAQ